MRLTLEDVIEQNKDRLFAAAFSVCQNPSDAEDIVQDTFLKYYTSDKEFDDEVHIRAWLIRVAVNRAKDLTVSFWKRNTTAWEDYMDTLEFEAPGDSRIFETVMRLPSKYRITLHLFYFEEYSVKEIAKTLGLREGTVKSQLSRGRTLLKQLLEEE